MSDSKVGSANCSSALLDVTDTSPTSPHTRGLPTNSHHRPHQDAPGTAGWAGVRLGQVEQLSEAWHRAGRRECGSGVLGDAPGRAEAEPCPHAAHGTSSAHCPSV